MLAHPLRTSFAGGLGIAAVLVAMHALVTGCGGSQETPPNTSAQAETARSPDGHHHHMPPPEAFEACKGKAIDEACNVQLHDREIVGKCAAPPPGAAQSTPACRPEGGPRHRKHHGPPPEIVFAACNGKSAGDACSVAFERGTVSGSCMAPRHAQDAGVERLLCAPAHPHRHDASDAGGK